MPCGSRNVARLPLSIEISVHPPVFSPGFRTSQGNEFYYVEPKAEEITAAQRTWLRAHLNKFERALYGASFKDASRGYPAFIDADSFIDHFWLRI